MDGPVLGIFIIAIVICAGLAAAAVGRTHPTPPARPTDDQADPPA